jgi:hypothetical protein
MKVFNMNYWLYNGFTPLKLDYILKLSFIYLFIQSV